MIICGTGHRPDKLGGYLVYDNHFRKMIRFTKRRLLEINPSKVYWGGALGFDTILGTAALELDIPTTLVVPFEGFNSKWSFTHLSYYTYLSRHCDVIILQPKLKNYWEIVKALDNRNKYMVDNSNLVLALWDGSSGGTKNCIDYAKSTNTQVINSWSLFKTHRNLAKWL